MIEVKTKLSDRSGHYIIPLKIEIWDTNIVIYPDVPESESTPNVMIEFRGDTFQTWLWDDREEEQEPFHVVLSTNPQRIGGVQEKIK